ncbi:hypothetical protein [Serratia quinivorans]|uniref:hypothetical protein n=1 Tax=Serratia quinivorans TaxID=137545 RepID=UPI002179DD7A|nr:hypothetical protein [Serratia quinivorans]CAI1114294.1 Uncharacterised protein [Serratia quinivorans]CAI2074019.1 Uncharacterised protein [Serratia quinivorans]
MKITFKQDVFDGLFQVANSQGVSPAALIEKITTDYVNSHIKRENEPNRKPSNDSPQF